MPRPATPRRGAGRGARARGGAGARHREATHSSIRGRCPAPRRAATTRRRALGIGHALAPRMVRAAACRNRARRPSIPASSTGTRRSTCVTDTHRLITSEGGDIVQRYRFLFPGMSVTAHADGDTQTRTLDGDRGICQQGGDEILGALRLRRRDAPHRRGGARAPRRAELPERDDGRAADAGPDDPADPRVDRPSARARPHPRRRAQLRRHELRHARHVRHATGTAPSCSTSRSTRRAAKSSRATAGTTTARRRRARAPDPRRDPGAAAGRRDVAAARRSRRAPPNARADNWNRPPIDRMANLNLEPGDATLDEMIAGIERGVLMETNCSWSIDDSRNKFQFGCECGRLIEDGKLRRRSSRTPTTAASARPSGAASRGSATRTRCRCSARRIAARASRRRSIRVGHASPACVFADVAVFGGEDES